MDVDKQKNVMTYIRNIPLEEEIMRYKEEMSENIPLEIGDGKKRKRLREVQLRESGVEKDSSLHIERSTVANQHGDRTQ